MTYLLHLVSPLMMRLIALTLLHFLWQGAALAAVAYAAMAFCRSASTRYALGVLLLVLMVGAPLVTLAGLLGQDHDPAAARSTWIAFVPAAISSVEVHSRKVEGTPAPGPVPNYFLWLVEIWFVGVMLCGLRSAGGVLVVEGLRRKESSPVGEDLLELCRLLQRKMDLQRVVGFCNCLRLDAPAVVGWFRPVVLLPVSALTGLSEAQLSSVIAHELAHIKRFDSFVNLFQIAVETLLFYHPAVWWLNKRIREERENCCDDMAVAVCGNPLTYAQALARMAECGASPRFLLAANHRPLAARVARLLGVGTSAAIRGTDLSLGLLCLSASIVAGVAFIGVVRNVHAQPPAQEAIASGETGNSVLLRVSPQPRSPRLTPLAVVAPVARPELGPSPAPVVTPQPQSPASPSSSYIDGLKSAGLDNLTIDQIIELKIQGVTPDYVRSMREIGLHADADNLVAMKIQGVTPDYVREMRQATGESLDPDELIGMKIQGISPEYVKQIHDLGLKADSGELIGMKVQGITPDYLRDLRALGLQPETGELIGMKVQGITPAYVKEINALGFHPDAGELIGMKVQGVDAGYLKQMQAAGFKLDVGEAIGAKVQGVTPEFIERVRSHGFKDLSLEQLIALKRAGVLEEEKQR